ncbi:tRNA lysidine(34) synthetase TilS [Solemya elarraichensis gill symbiont]|uniref:tRNA lysidine(34) synthetase TilS n=1 Tax=Solemya elarraichensis gill symbiont TaxID=1918949 RepID=UPI001428AA22|nr:tRNA lysidine(34) synthetase TilS [Solemya elarraichensis gill symbiont]
MKRGDTFNPQQLLQVIEKAPPTGRFLLALSGGVDSIVLLDALVAIRQSLLPAQFIAVHVNHQIHPHAAAWADQCQQVCDSHDVELSILTVEVGKEDGPEASARQARYDAIAGIMEPGDVLLSAHHLDDQAETLLLNLMRGSGLRGLAGMPLLRPFTDGWLMRPLLDCSRQQLLEYAEKRELEWIDDPSNLDESLDRNFVRHSVIPLLQQRWPAASDSLATSAGLLQESDELLGKQVEEELAVCMNEQACLLLPKLLEHDKKMQAMLVRKWCESRGFASLPRARLYELLKQLKATGDRQPVFTWSDLFIGRHTDRLIAHQLLPQHDIRWRTQWNGNEPLQLPADLGILRSTGNQFDMPLEVGFRCGGERLLQGGMHRDLKTVFNTHDVPAWLRERIPLLFRGGELIAVADIQAGDSAGIQISWERGSGWPNY